MRGLRRGSILGPILLIAIGVIFLLVQTGRLDQAHVWDWYGHWWPFLLVAAGLVMLGEWAVDQFLMRDPQRPPYRRSLGGGIFLLILFFSIAGLLALALALAIRSAIYRAAVYLAGQIDGSISRGIPAPVAVSAAPAGSRMAAAPQTPATAVVTRRAALDIIERFCIGLALVLILWEPFGGARCTHFSDAFDL